MIGKIKRWFSNSSLLLKIHSVIIGLTIFITLLILFFAFIYYQYIVNKTIEYNIRTSTKNTANTLDLNYSSILQRFVSTIGTEEFSNILSKIIDPESNTSINETLVQSQLKTLTNSNSLINSAFIISGDGEIYYTLHENSIRKTATPFLQAEELLSITQITPLPERKTLFYGMQTVLPLVFPIRIGAYNYTEITNASQKSDAFVVLLFDSSKITSVLMTSNDTELSNTYLIVDKEGSIIYQSKSENLTYLFETPEVKTYIKSLQPSVITNFNVNSLYLSAIPIFQNQYYLINYYQPSSFSNIFGVSGLLIISILLIVILVLFTLSFLLTRYIISPINLLVQVVHLIEQNKYDKLVVFHSKDEIGKLSFAINKMHSTIQEQILQIKEEETLKYQAEIKLLAEQINPHFLYNTLECIQMEVIGNHSQVAASMIQYLADYLRTGLSYGEYIITISQELSHVHAYIEIMNQRFHQSMLFLPQIGGGLEDYKIIKTILQPLVENSIKHGFSIDQNGLPILSPSIEIIFEASSDTLCIHIIDNGVGFDPEETKKVLYHNNINKKNTSHVGLSNTYHRLCAYYGKENVAFELSSIPYYENKISIFLPLDKTQLI